MAKKAKPLSAKEYLEKYGTGASGTGPTKAPKAKKAKPLSAKEYLEKYGSGGADPVSAAAPGPVEKAKANNSPLGLLKQARDAVQSLPTGLVSAGAAIGKEVGGLVSGSRDIGEFREDLPILTELVSSPFRTLSQVADPRKLVQEIQEEGGVNTALRIGSDVALLAGGVGAIGKAAGAGRLAKISKAETLAAAAARSGGVPLKAAKAGALAEDATALSRLATARKAAGVGEEARKVAALDIAAKQLGTAQSLLAKGPITTGERITNAATQTGRLGANVAGSPAQLYTKALPYLGRKSGLTAAAAPVFTALASSPKFQEALTTSARKLRIDKDSRRGRQLIHDAEANADQHLVDIQRGDTIVSSILKDTDEAMAATLIVMGDADGLAAIRAAVSDPEYAPALRSVGHTPRTANAQLVQGIVDKTSERAVAIAAHYATSTLPAEQLARLKAGVEATKTHILAPQEGRFLKGHGSLGLSKAGLAERAEGLGTAPLSRPLLETTAKFAGKRAEKINKINKLQETLARKQATLAENKELIRAAGDSDAPALVSLRSKIVREEERVARLSHSLGLAKQSLKNLGPAEVRALEKVANKITSAPARYRPMMQDMRAAAAEGANIRRAVAAAAGEDAAVAIDRMLAEIPTTLAAINDAGISPTFLKGKLPEKGAAKLVTGTTPRLSPRKKLMAEHGKKGDVVGETPHEQALSAASEVTNAVRNEARRSFEREMGIKGGAIAKGLDGAELEAAAKAIGREAFDPTFRGRSIPADKITADTVFVPSHLLDQFGKYFGPDSDWEKLLQKTFDPTQRVWKHTVLALSPRWITGNVIGNTVLAGLGGGVTPLQAMRYWGEASRMLKEGRLPIEFERSGFLSNEARSLADKGGLIARSYRLNEKTDNFNRSLIYLTKKGKGLDHQTAINLALRAAGDFRSMTRFEQRVMRRIFPFYVWQRHITKLAFTLPVTNPARVAWTLHLSDLGRDGYSDEDQERANQGYLRLSGGRRVSLQQLGPLGTSFLTDPTVSGLGFTLSPVIKTAGAGITGVSASKGFRPVYQKGRKFGATPSPLVTDPVAWAEYAFNQVGGVVPAKNIISSLRGRGVPYRDELGAPTDKDYGGRGTATEVARFFGIPLPDKIPPKRKR